MLKTFIRYVLWQLFRSANHKRLKSPRGLFPSIAWKSSESAPSEEVLRLYVTPDYCRPALCSCVKRKNRWAVRRIISEASSKETTWNTEEVKVFRCCWRPLADDLRLQKNNVERRSGTSQEGRSDSNLILRDRWQNRGEPEVVIVKNSDCRDKMYQAGTT